MITTLLDTKLLMEKMEFLSKVLPRVHPWGKHVPPTTDC